MNESWDNPEGPGFFAGLKLRWRTWRDHRRLLAEERREMLRVESELKSARQGEIRESGVGRDSSGRSYASSQVQSDEDRMVSRSSSGPDGPLPNFDEPAESGGLLAQFRASAQMRRAMREEKKAIEAEFRRSSAAPGPAAGPGDEFGVGDTRLSVEDQDANAKFSARRLFQTLWSELVRLRIPQWIVAVVPSVAFFASTILPAMTDSETLEPVHIREYQEKWPALVASSSWKEAELCGNRILNFGNFSLDEDFRYFQCLSQARDVTDAVRFILTREAQIRSSELAKFRFRMAEELSRLPGIANRPGMRNLIISKVRESLSGPLSEQEELKARQILANVAIVQGNFDEATRILEPIASRSPLVAADVLFLKFNNAPDESLAQLRSAAAGLLVAVDTQRAGNSDSDFSTLRTRLRLLMILDREKEARDFLATIENLSPEDRKAIGLELEKLSLLTEGRKKPVQAEVLWTRLKPLLESEPGNEAWTRLALGIWAGSEKQAGTPIDRWVREKLQSESADIAFLRLGCMATHTNGRWEDARTFYRKLLEKDPKDVSALNNLAGLMYKFTPRDLNQSLKLVDSAIELAPGNLVVLETRGQVLARMGRFDEAREILVRTLPALPREWNLHNTLAQIYDRMNDPQNAEAHRNILQKIPKPRDADQYAVLADFAKDSPRQPAPADRR